TQKRPHFIQSVIRPVPSTPHEHTPRTHTNFHVNGWAAGPYKLKIPPQGLCSSLQAIRASGCAKNPGTDHAPGAPAFDEQCARSLTCDVSHEENSDTQSDDPVGEPQIASHTQRGIGQDIVRYINDEEERE